MDSSISFPIPENKINNFFYNLGRGLLGISTLCFLCTALLQKQALFSAWAAFTLTFGLAAVGGVSYAIGKYRGTTPGIKHHGLTFFSSTARGYLAWAFGIGITAFYVALYFYEQLVAKGLPKVLDSWIWLVDPLSQFLRGGSADKWFLYGSLYTLAVLVMGVRMLFKYRHNRYQQIRTVSVMFFQLGFAFLLPAFLRSIEQEEFYFTYFWPLKYDYLFPGTVQSLVSNGGIGIFMFAWAAIMTFIATPVLTYFYGKRWYCSWVCGCGGLAETLGDPFRQHSDKSEKAWVIERWMIHLVLLSITVITALLWLNDYKNQTIFGSSTQAAKQIYGLYIGAIFSGVIGVGFYPILGSRVWCRFGCPMAAILGLIQRCFSRFRITTNGGQCISCGNCSTYCEMGIDVRAYAQRGENIVRSSCVGCGVCAAVCPRGVLALENGSTSKDRFKNAENPLKVLTSSLVKRNCYDKEST